MTLFDAARKRERFYQMVGILKRSGRENIGSDPFKNFRKLKRLDVALARLKNFPLFDSADYQSRYRDLARNDPVLHFVSYGAQERRVAASAQSIARVLGDIRSQPMLNFVGKGGPIFGTTIGVYCSSLGNVFMHDIAEDISASLRAAGYNVYEGSENSDIDERPLNAIYVAPHEFFILGNGARWVRDDVLEHACMYCTEQPQTTWFWNILPLVLAARSVIDMSVPVANVFSMVMPAANILPDVRPLRVALTDVEWEHPLFYSQHWWQRQNADSDFAYDDRPIDVSFLGADSDHRGRYFSKDADLFSTLECFFYFRQRNKGTVVNEDNDGINLSRLGSWIAQASKIALNVHRDEFPYFEWHRIVRQGIAQGALVLSEPCFEDAVFKAGVHYLTEEARYLGEMACWLLQSHDGLRVSGTIRKNAIELLNETDRGAKIGAALASFLAGGQS